MKQLIETFEADWERSNDKRQPALSQPKEGEQKQEVVDGQPEISEQAAEMVVQVFTEELDPSQSA